MAGIDWMDWGEKAFERARRERKPVLLDISAVWCHWCHVMDQKTYADPDVAGRIADGFVPVRVDTDRHPDINARYNMGGWPTTAFLTPDGEILTGATYLPPGEMKKALDRVSRFYREHEEELAQAPRDSGSLEAGGPNDGGSRGDRARPAGDRDGSDGGSDNDSGGDQPSTTTWRADAAADALGGILDLAEDSYDAVHGGFGTAPKFPQTALLSLLLVGYLRQPRKSRPREARSGWLVPAEPEPRPYLDMLTTTLKAMRERGLYDHVAGGFFRYSTTGNWEIPHYEKMLEDNAGLMALYARVGRLTGSLFYREVVEEVARYLETTLRSADGYFCGSQDADEEYYKLDAEERANRDAPRVDRTLYVGWNARAARGFLEAYYLLGDKRLRELGLVALERTWAAARLDPGRPGAESGGSGPTDSGAAGGLFRHYVDDKGPGGPVLLVDAADMALALLDAYEATGERGFLDRASRLLDRAREAFGDPAGPGFFDTLPAGASDCRVGAGARAVGRLRFRAKDLDANARLCLALLRLGDITMDPEPRLTAQTTLAWFLGRHHRYGILAAEYGLALDWAVGPVAEVTLVGRLAERRGQNLAMAAVTAVTAARVVRWEESSGEAEARVCSGRTCLDPLTDPAKVPAALRAAAERGVKTAPGMPGGIRLPYEEWQDRQPQGER